MRGLPGAVLRKLSETLVECGPFGAQETLLAVFADERIAPFRNQIPVAQNADQRARLFISQFLNTTNRGGQCVLVLFLQALNDQVRKYDSCHEQLNDVAIEVAVALSNDLPPLARTNMARAFVAGTGEALPDMIGGYELAPDEPEPTSQSERLTSTIPARVFRERLETLKNKAMADWLPVSFLEKGLLAARAVGRVEYQGRKIGTGFLVAPNLLLTNAHVIRNILTLGEGSVQFNVGLEATARRCYFAEQIQYSPVEELDFALVRLTTPINDAPPVTLSGEAAYPKQAANILQHPYGQSMQVALRYNEIVHVDRNRIYYVTDTEQCSSGSPVFDDDWRVIGLHRAGIVDDAQRPVKNANQGVPISAIKVHIEALIDGG